MSYMAWSMSKYNLLTGFRNKNEFGRVKSYKGEKNIIDSIFLGEQACQ